MSRRLTWIRLCAVSALLLQTAMDCARSGKQSWAWYMRGPDAEQIEAQVAAAGKHLGPVLRQLLLFGFETFDKYPELAAAMRQRVVIPKLQS